ncbi:thiamine phosphate synthase [Micromonospora polyrhachis]|uniref:Thiamine-phosphate diphosphorylase n=1 Tax=Micromonospora polyrhachis TaxID=1282883 RepID=A0A7W7SNU9_9ACTN|nr:thiamine phosphate synthase [Micromonospora polyrhachis]MBB4958210.1 thiamine-phosphate diphosphorylase [Micromonospora polyrhachis]
MNRRHGASRIEGDAAPAEVLLFTDRRQASRPLTEVVRAAVAGGARWVVLRERELPHVERARLADQLRTILDPVAGQLIVAGPDPLGGGAVHLPATGRVEPPAMELSTVSPGAGAKPRLVGRSCHDLAELDRLTIEDYVTLSPVFPSRSKPGYGPPLFPAGLARLVRHTRVPVFALGGVASPDQVVACRAAGAAGVAVMGAVMRADDPTGVVRALLDAVAEPVVGATRSGVDR